MEEEEMQRKEYDQEKVLNIALMEEEDMQSEEFENAEYSRG